MGGHGYGEIIKEIRSWYPDDGDALRSKHKKELDQRNDALVKSGMSPMDPRLREALDAFFDESLALMKGMTAAQCDGCYDTIFESYLEDGGVWVEDFKEGAGAPDLLVWHPNPSLKLWFFCEVKSHNDHLGQAQHAWLQRSWGQIEGRFLLLLLTSGSVPAPSGP